jgi:hypothetical protein
MTVEHRLCFTSIIHTNLFAWRRCDHRLKKSYNPGKLRIKIILETWIKITENLTMIKKTNLSI